MYQRRPFSLTRFIVLAAFIRELDLLLAGRNQTHKTGVSNTRQS
jgi:hypothetical protein